MVEFDGLIPEFKIKVRSIERTLVPLIKQVSDKVKLLRLLISQEDLVFVIIELRWHKDSAILLFTQYIQVITFTQEIFQS